MAEAKLETVRRNDSLNGVREERISLPFGDVICKWWGPREQRPIVCLHGWLDNAGSFDRLLPLLPRHISFLAIDIPGHGRSTHLPAGVAYYALDTLRLLLYVMQYYGWQRISLMSHSIGAIMSYVFAGVFPDRVDLLISFDLLKPFILDPDMLLFLLADSLPKTLDYNTDTNETRGGKLYEYDQLVEHMHIGFHESISRDACHFLLYRAVEPALERTGYVRRRTDPRVRHNHGLVWSHDLNLEIARRIKAPFLYVKTTETPLFEDPQYHQETLDMLAAHNKDFVQASVEGKHHVHLSDPNRVAPLVSEFLTKYWTKEDYFQSKL
ncbi:hypothetical protein ZHAS_00007357 [Anopheles sinensis]|uniref:AB hydrolase-1 domain-containing protein n=1 Tax=Anopheles sinensis TaxID=74873 RepID=A0A084VPS8_ANOSI|nr:hypothetical protein ZHAS_00007357 [Anopheles sinensis]